MVDMGGLGAWSGVPPLRTRSYHAVRGGVSRLPRPFGERPGSFACIRMGLRRFRGCRLESVDHSGAGGGSPLLLLAPAQ